MVSAPYNFVPLSNTVCTAKMLSEDLAETPAQDIPEKGGLSNVLPFTITCTTPLLIGDGDKKFITAPDSGKPIIPGSSLRGMIRNVMEIASFARMQFVDDQRVGVRDLDAILDYRSRLKDIRAGWLRLAENGKGFELTECDFARVSHKELDRHSRGFYQAIDSLARKNSADERGAKQVQEAFRGSPKGTFQTKDNGQVTGTLVFTGLPGTKNNRSSKKHEFVFFNNSKTWTIPGETWQRFIAVHEKQEKESETWKWRKGQLDRGGAIPVFWLPGANDVPEQIGLAMMFRIAADNSIHEMIAHTAEDHNNDTLLDLPTRIFGQVADAGRGFRTRVSFGWATLQGDAPTPEEFTVIAARPKPSFVPSYVRQRDFADTSGKRLLSWGKREKEKAQYRSYMNWHRNGKLVQEEIRGWKRYPIGPDATPEQAADIDAASTLSPIRGTVDKPLKFKGKIRYHNLHPIELGALVWALNWGGNDTLRHSLGMGRAYGWGQVQITLEEDVAALQEPFVEAMERAKPGWANTPQIRQLLAMANPAVGAKNKGILKQMVLDPKGKNEFRDAKQRRNVLPEYPPANTVTPGIKEQAKGYRPPQQGGRAQPCPTPSAQKPDGPLREGSAVWYGGEATIITAINGEVVIVEYEDGGTEKTTLNELKPR